MTFTAMAVNKSNSYQVVRLPVEIVCIKVKRIYGSCLNRREVTLRWDFHAEAQESGLDWPQEIISCRIKEVKVKECHLRPTRFKTRVVVEVCYLVTVAVVYQSNTGRIETAVLQKELCRRSRPLPGTPALEGAADITLELSGCRVEK